MDLDVTDMDYGISVVCNIQLCISDTTCKYYTLMFKHSNYFDTHCTNSFDAIFGIFTTPRPFTIDVLVVL